MPAKRAKAANRTIAAEMTSAQLGRLLDLPRMPMSDALFKAAANEGGKYDLVKTLPLVIAHFRAKAERSLNTEARNRQQMAEAETAEIKAAQARNELMLRADCKSIWKDGLVKFIQIIKGAAYIPAPSRDKLVKQVREIDVEEPE